MNFIQRLKLKSLEKKARNLYERREKGENVNRVQEIKANLDLAKFYDLHLHNKKFPNAEDNANEYYRAAGNLGDPNALYIFGKRRLDKARFWDEWLQGVYGLPIHKNYASQYYNEAFEYFKKAEESGSPLALRLHGLAYIHGWGVPQDKETGFKMVVQSIDEENAWDRATEIFKEIGLNTPDFFSSIMAIKQRQ